MIQGYLISESTSFSVPQIVRDSASEVTTNNPFSGTQIKVILQDGDVVNRNKRIYPTEVIKRGLASEYVQERLKTKSWYGEAGHPLSPTLERQVYIDQSNISHIILETEWQNNILYGLVETANTARGKDMQGLIRQGSKVAFSLRAYGPVCTKKGDITYVQDPLHILTFDWVLHPSHRPAYMQSIIHEDADIFERKNIERQLLESGYFVDLKENTTAENILQESTCAKKLMEQYEFGNNSKMAISNDHKQIFIKQNERTLACNIEDALKYDLDRYFSK